MREKVSDKFAVGLAFERDGFQNGFYFAQVFDDAVMHDCEIAVVG